MSLVTQAFSAWYFSWTSGDPHRSGFKLHTAVLSVLCDVPSIAVFCSESIECFPGTASKFFLRHLVTIPVAPIITGIIVHFRFHIRCISIHKLLYFNLFSASFCTLLLLLLLLTTCPSYDRVPQPLPQGVSLFLVRKMVSLVCCNFAVWFFFVVSRAHYAQLFVLQQRLPHREHKL